MEHKKANPKRKRLILLLLVIGLFLLPLLLCSPLGIRAESEASVIVVEKIPEYREENPFAGSASLETIRQYAEIVGDTPEGQLSEEQLIQIEQLNLTKEEQEQCQESLSAVLEVSNQAETQEKFFPALWVGYGLLLTAGIIGFLVRCRRSSLARQKK